MAHHDEQDNTTNDIIGSERASWAGFVQGSAAPEKKARCNSGGLQFGVIPG